MPADVKKILSELTGALKEAVDAAKDDDAKKEARDEFFDTVRDAAPDLYNAIHGAARNAAAGEEGKKTARVQKLLDAAKQEAIDLREKLEEAEKGKPDVVALTAKAEAARQKAVDALAAKEAEYAARERQRTLHDATLGIEAALVEAGYRPKAAKGEVLRMRDEGRIKLNDDGAVEFYQLRDATQTYPSPKSGEAPFAGLVKDLVKSADALDLASAVDRGGGVGSAGSGTRGVPAGPPAMPGRIDRRDPTVARKLETNNYGAV
jgi:hypothetical protein